MPGPGSNRAALARGGGCLRGQRGPEPARRVPHLSCVVGAHSEQVLLRRRQPFECRVRKRVAAHTRHERGIGRHVGRRRHHLDGVAHGLVEAALRMTLRDQVIVGVVLNVLVIGLTSFLFSTLLAPNAALLNTPPRFERINIPLLSEIPLLGPVLFRQTIIVYLMYIAVFVVWFGLFKTRWGLRLRSVGEHPQAADTVGINVSGTRFWNVSLAGAIAGLGGAYFTLGSVGAFNKEMTAGAGFIALAAVIFGRWDPIRTTLAALLFGFASNLQSVLSIIGSPVPSEFMLMLPYLVTIFAVAGLVGRVRGPAAAGKPYIKS